MKSVSINIRLRPLRFAFLIRPDDKKHTLDAFRINTCLWGGKFNPIIPYFKQVPKWWDKNGFHFENARQILNGYLDFFEPDFIVESEKGMANGLNFDPERVLQFSDLLIPDEERNIESFGLDVNSLYIHFYKKEFQFKLRHKPNIILVKTKNSKFYPLAACLFGSFPIVDKLKYFEINYRDIFEPKEIELNGASLLEIYKKPFSSPLKLGHAKIDINNNNYNDPALFILNSFEPRDLIDFWNLRIVQPNVIAVPLQWIQELSQFCKEFFLCNYRPLPGNHNGVMIQPIAMFSRSINKEDSSEIFNKYLKVDKNGASGFQQWYPSIWRPTPEDRFPTTRPILCSDKNSIEISLDIEKPVIKFDTLWPEFITDSIKRNQIANVIRIEGWGDDDQIATSFPCNYRNPTFPKFQYGHGQLLPTSEGLVYIPQYKNISERWELMSGTHALNRWFNENNIKAVFSDAGRVTQQIIQNLEGFWGVGKIANAGIVKLLNEMSRKPLTRSMHHDEFRQKIQKALGTNIWRFKEFETLVERNVVELGLELKCSKCDSWGWHQLKNLDYSLTCDLCLQRFDFPITNPSDSNLTKWAYRVIGPFALPDYAKGGYASALAIRFFSSVLERFDRGGVTWSAGQELTLQSGKKIEADFIIWYQRRRLFSTDYPTEIIFGESKSFGKDVFKEENIQNAMHLAQTFPGAALVFATMKEADEISKEEVLRLRKLAEWGREYDKEKKQSRAPVIILTGTELFAADLLVHAWKQKGGMHAQLITPGWIRVENLRTLADLTQQLYLNMPPYYEWLKRKRELCSTRKKKK